MLRHLFGEPRRVDDGLLLDASRAIETYLEHLSKRSPQEPRENVKTGRLRLLSKGLGRALDELEQSIFCAARYGEGVGKRFVEEMTEEERDSYHRHIYFYKNAFIRLFAILDKIGYFLNELFELETEKVKERFSYFTVLRTMHQRGVGAPLEQTLFEMKQQYKPQMQRLRNQRNMEIHWLNADLLDDLMRTMEARQTREKRTHVENIEDNMADLQAAYEMTCKVVTSVFTYIVGHDRGKSGR
ncbi:Cthe_2314 family HEPN domain-containing protein [Paenibacillus hamazuiensis]|uniref:Cthe_2314 family HEPN domain-containing protein n=1 Tax=Paenibacillus hamazuiensis TaxID=2936508 RepID=UPI00200FE342|nr:Cthe_2314 family HEPN domain-containing protein [Paenibacillus hamazuiensis]